MSAAKLLMLVLVALVAGHSTAHNLSIESIVTSHRQLQTAPVDSTGGVDFVQRCDRADVTGDGAVTVDDILMALTQFHCVAPQPCSADVTGPGGVADGVINVQDMLEVISMFGVTCELPCDSCYSFCPAGNRFQAGVTLGISNQCHHTAGNEIQYNLCDSDSETCEACNSVGGTWTADLWSGWTCWAVSQNAADIFSVGAMTEQQTLINLFATAGEACCEGLQISDLTCSANDQSLHVSIKPE
jgi:hypothetical protein